MIIAQEEPVDVFTELSGGQTIVGADGVQHPWQITDAWSDAELNAIGVYRVPEATVPKGRSVVSSSISRVDGVVTQVLVFGDLVADLTAYNAAARYAIETRGLNVSLGFKVRTDRQSQLQIDSTATHASMTGSVDVQWKADDGTFHSLTSAQVKNMSLEVTNHVQGCFGTEASTKDQIVSGAVVTAEAIDAIYAAIPDTVGAK